MKTIEEIKNRYGVLEHLRLAFIKSADDDCKTPVAEARDQEQPARGVLRAFTFSESSNEHDVLHISISLV